jgi:hypothetical protein
MSQIHRNAELGRSRRLGLMNEARRWGVADLGARVFVVCLVQAVFPSGPGTIRGKL